MFVQVLETWVESKESTETDSFLGMSTTNSSQASFRELFPVPLTYDPWTCGIASSKPGICLTSNPVMPLRNSNWFYAPGLLHISDIPPLGRQVQPYKNVLSEAVEVSSLLSEPSLYVRDAACTLPGYHNLPQMAGRTAPQLKWQAAVYEPSVDVSCEKPPTGNVWDMLVGLLGKEQSTDFVNTTGKISTSCLDGKHYFSKADVSITSLQTGSNQEDSIVNSYQQAISANVGYQNSVKVFGGDVYMTEKQRNMKLNNTNHVAHRHQFPTANEDCQCASLCEQKVKIGPLCGSTCPLVAPDEKVNASITREIMSNRNNETLFKRTNDLVPVKIHEDNQQSAAFMHVTKVAQQKSISSKSNTSKSRRKGLVLSKQRKKLKKTKLCMKVTLKARDKLPFPKTGEERSEQKPNGYLSIHTDFGPTVESEKFIQDPVIQPSRTVGNASLSKITSITMQCCDKEKDVFMWPGTMMKFLNPLPKYERLHSVLMNNHKDESGTSNAVVLKFDVQSRLSLESKFGHDDVRRPLLGHTESFNQNSHFTELLMSAQVPELQDMSKSSKLSQITSLWDLRGAVNLREPLVDELKSLEDRVHEAGTFSVCKMKSSPFLQVDCDGLVPHDELLESQERQNVHSPAQVCLQGTEGNSNQFAATMEEMFPPEQQLKLLLHAGHCQLPEV